LLRAAYHAGITVCNCDRESSSPNCLPLSGDPRSNFQVHFIFLTPAKLPIVHVRYTCPGVIAASPPALASRRGAGNRTRRPALHTVAHGGPGPAATRGCTVQTTTVTPAAWRPLTWHSGRSRVPSPRLVGCRGARQVAPPNEPLVVMVRDATRPSRGFSQVGGGSTR
jgi:hypothetical protein